MINMEGVTFIDFSKTKSITLNPVEGIGVDEMLAYFISTSETALDDQQRQKAIELLSRLPEERTVLDAVTMLSWDRGLRSFAFKVGKVCLPGNGYAKLVEVIEEELQ